MEGLSLVHTGNDEISIMLLSHTGGVTLAKVNLNLKTYQSCVPQALGVLPSPVTFNEDTPDLNLKAQAYGMPMRGVLSDHWADGLKLGLSDTLLDTLRGFVVRDLEAASIYLGLTCIWPQQKDLETTHRTGFWTIAYMAQGDGFGWCWVGAGLKTRELISWWADIKPSRVPSQKCWVYFLGRGLVPEKMKSRELFGYLIEQVKTSHWVGRTPQVKR